MKKPNFYMLVGLSGSGKSSYKFEEEIIKVSSDALRAELYGDENDQAHNSEIFNELHRRIINFLKKGNNVVYDATNLSRRRRIAFLNNIKYINCTKNCIVFATSYKECIKRDSERDKTVGKSIILKQMRQFQMPIFNEGWNNIFIRQVEITKRENLGLILKKCREISHDNPYHLESIGEHMNIAYELAKNKNEKPEIISALLYHDIGKIITKDFYNSKGEKTNIAHYYNHEKVSSYLFLTSEFFSFGKTCSKIQWLIENHMRPYFQGYEKWREKQNKDLIQDLEIFHEYDKLARLT